MADTHYVHRSSGQYKFRPVVERNSDSLRFAFAGDLCMPPQAAVPGDVFARTACLNAIGKRVHDADIGVVNLEGPIVEELGVQRAGVTVHLHNAPEVLKAASMSGFDVLNLANNHIMDFGPAGLASTLEHISRAGLKAVGAGQDRVTASKPLCITVRGRRVGLLAFTTDVMSVRSVLATYERPGCASLCNAEEVLKSIRFLRREVDLVCVLVHWGQEFYQYPAWEQIVLARQMVDAGAGLVIGHHPHMLQGVEYYRDGFIAYSLGNFFFPRLRSDNGRMIWEKPLSREFLLVAVDIDDQMRPQASFLAGQKVRDRVLVPYQGKALVDFARRYERLCAPLTERDYESRWISYAARRSKELSREATREAILKALHTPVSDLVRTIRFEDVRRNLDRLAHM
jgi:hypothetical protein